MYTYLFVWSVHIWVYVKIMYQFPMQASYVLDLIACLFATECSQGAPTNESMSSEGGSDT